MIVALSDTSSLLRPLAERDVLIPNEQVYYAERQHWASIVQPVYETFIFLLFIVFIADVQATGGLSTTNRWVGLILLLALIQIGAVAISGGRAPTSRLAVDPFASGGRSGVNPLLRWTIAIGLLLMLITYGLRTTGIVLVFLVVGRLITILARWTFYERRYITNRRLIESSGFLGSRISSMPLPRVTDIVYGRTVPGEIFGYARMRIETAGQDQALGLLFFINEPDHFYEVLVNFSAPQAPSST